MILRRLRLIFRASSTGISADAFARFRESFSTAQAVIPLFYACSLFLAISSLPNWNRYLQSGHLILLWPIAWLDMLEWKAGISMILILYLSSALLCVIFPQYRSVRFLFFLGLLFFGALRNSFGKISHSMHLWLMVSFLLILLPQNWNERNPPRRRQLTVCTIFWGCQILILAIYSMSGLGKVCGIIYQMAMGEAHALLPGALGLHVADRLIQTNSESILGSLVIAHPIWFWPFLPVTIYLQFFALWAAYRPSIQKFWAVGLIVFHIASYLMMAIDFASHCLLLALFFLISRPQSNGVSLKHMLSELPLFGVFLRALFRYAGVF